MKNLLFHVVSFAISFLVLYALKQLSGFEDAVIFGLAILWAEITSSNYSREVSNH